jgi:hypothetical protein
MAVVWATASRYCELAMSTNMLHRGCALEKYLLLAVDGIIGYVTDYYFDKTGWEVRYLLASTDNCCHARYVLISSVAVGSIQPDEKTIYIELSRKQIENSPPIGRHQSVSKQYEKEFYSYYGWPPYWEQNGTEVSVSSKKRQARTSETDENIIIHPLHRTRVQSAGALCGCTAVSTDGAAGRVDDLILDTRYWLIRYLQINLVYGTSHKQVLISPGWVEHVNLQRRLVSLDIPGRIIRRAPAFDRTQYITTEYEARLIRHYGNPVFWRRCSDRN